LHIITQSHPAKPWRPIEARPSQEKKNHQFISGGEGQAEARSKSRRRRTSRSQEQVQEVKDKLAAEPGGVGKPEASPHQQQAAEAVHITSTAQLQASGKKKLQAYYC
jgi:hypothetical protein